MMSLAGVMNLFVITASMYALTSWSLAALASWLKGLLDRVAAIISCFPGTCTAFMLNRIRCIKSLWHCTGALSKLHVSQPLEQLPDVRWV